MTLKTVLAGIQLVLMAVAGPAAMMSYRLIKKPRSTEPENTAVDEGDETSFSSESIDRDEKTSLLRDALASWSSLTELVRDHTMSKCEMCVGPANAEAAQTFWSAMRNVQQSAMASDFKDTRSQQEFLENITAAQERWDELHGKETLF